MTDQDKHSGNYDIVGIGSSAGGLHALMTVLPIFPRDLPASILIVQHLDPRYESHMADILTRFSSMRIIQAEDGMQVEKGAIYIAPPDKHMLLEEDHIRLTSTQLVHFVRPSVDLLLESIAATSGSRSIGVILTGSGTDGALGIRAIKEVGGLTIVQDPATAESTGMPNTAIATGLVDMVLRLDEIGPTVVAKVTQGRSDG